MAELIPIIGGSLAGALGARFAAGRARWVWLCLASLALAVIAGVVSDELERSLAFLAWDMMQAVLAGALCQLLYLRARARSRRQTQG